MRKFWLLVFLTLWLIWLTRPAIIGQEALGVANKSILYYVLAGIVTVFVSYFKVWEDLVRYVLIVVGSIRGP